MGNSLRDNWLDRTIGWFSPEAGLRRSRARAAREILLSYEGVRSDRRMGGWRTTGASGNAEIGTGLHKLRENARDLVRNNAFARKAVREWSKRAVGWGITPQADTGDAGLNERIDAFFLRWAKECCSDQRLNFYALQSLICSTQFVSGECLVRIYPRRPSDGLAVPFQIQVLEPDWLDTAKIGPVTGATNGSYVIQGVQFNSIGGIEGYWLFGNHPGEVVQTSLRGAGMSKFVPAEFVLHHLEIDRPGNARAVTHLAAVINKLRDIGEYADAEIVRKKLEACYTALVTQAEGPEGPTGGPVALDAEGRKIEAFEPGMMMYGSPGTDIKFLSPAHSGDYADHKVVEMREVAAGLGIPYVLLGEHLSDVNYSSYRGGALSFRDEIESYRWKWLMPQVLDPLWDRLILTLKELREIPADTPSAVKWSPPPFDLLDREAEANADQMELQIGKTSWPQLVGAQGFDPEKQFAEIEAWKSRLADAGVNFFGSQQEDGGDDGKDQGASQAATRRNAGIGKRR